MKTYAGHIVLLLSLTSLLAGAPPKKAHHVKSPTIYQAANPTGKWHCWDSGSEGGRTAANKSYLWFGRGDGAWRYNISTRKIDRTITALSHPTLRGSWGKRIAMSNDGQTVASCYDRNPVCLHDGNQWRRLPLVCSKRELEWASYILFDQKNRLWAFSKRVAMVWDAKTNRWEEKYRIDKTKKFSRIAALPEGYWYARIESKGKTKAYILDSSFHATKTLSLTRGAVYPTAKGVVLVHLKDGANRVFMVNETGETQTSTCQIVGIDYGSDSLFTGEFITKPGQQEPSEIEWQDAQGRDLGTTPIPPVDTANQRERISMSIFCRDSNGDLWWKNWRHDGTRWAPIAPRSASLPSWATSRSLLSGRLTWQSKTQTWLDAAGGFPHRLFAYDRATNTGWTITSVSNESQAKKLLQRWKFAKGKPPMEIGVHDLDGKYLAPLFMTGKDLWLRNGYRYRGGSLHRFDVGTVPKERGWSKKGAPVHLARHPSGSVWMYDVMRSWKRYDPKQDKFVYDQPYDVFSFEVAGRTLAIVGEQNNTSWDYHNSTVGMVYEKRNGEWSLLTLPFAPNTISYWVCAQPERKALWKNRLLVATIYGVFEIDLKSNRWARLTRGRFIRAWFDGQGRRWMETTYSWRQAILMYDGDPFQPGEAANKLAQASIPAKQRNSLPEHLWRIPAYQDARWGRPLFDRMNPPIPAADDRWTVSVGMKFIDAHATIKRLGDLYLASSLGKRFYVLPDLSLLTIGYPKKSNTVESITHTPARTDDVDPVPQPVQSFDLRPYARQPKPKVK